MCLSCLCDDILEQGLPLLTWLFYADQESLGTFLKVFSWTHDQLQVLKIAFAAENSFTDQGPVVQS